MLKSCKFLGLNVCIKLCDPPLLGEKHWLIYAYPLLSILLLLDMLYQTSLREHRLNKMMLSSCFCLSHPSPFFFPKPVDTCVNVLLYCLMLETGFTSFHSSSPKSISTLFSLISSQNCINSIVVTPFQFDRYLTEQRFGHMPIMW